MNCFGRELASARPVIGRVEVLLPKIAVFDPYPWPAGYESYNQLRFFLEQVLELPWTRVTGPDVEAGQLTTDGIDVFIVPGVPFYLSSLVTVMRAFKEGRLVTVACLANYDELRP